MKLSKTLFANLFTSNNITPSRLRAFAKAVLANLSKNNKNGQYDALIALLTSRLGALSADMNDIDLNVGSQKISTKKMRAFIKTFATFMSKKAPFIADALGGEESDGYLSFYPSGISEYNKPSYPKTEELTSRVQAVATTYQKQLGDKLAQPMLLFSDDFDALFDDHLEGDGTVKTERAERTGALLQLQMGLTQAVFTVGSLYTGNDEMCEAIFPFNMLYPALRRLSKLFEGGLAIGEATELMNYRFGNKMDMNIDNRANNSDIALWLAYSSTDPRPAKVFVVKAGENKPVRLARLGNLEKTSLMVANLSTVNSAFYIIEVMGLRKEKKAKPESKKAAAKKETKKKIEVA